MSIKFICLMPALALYIVSKMFPLQRTFFKRMVAVGPGLLQWCIALTVLEML